MKIKQSPILLILLFCLTLISPTVFAQIEPRSPQQLIQQGQELYRTQKYDSAVSIWQKAIASSPENSLNQAIALSNLSLTYQKLGQWQEAENSINQSIAILQSLPKTEEKSKVFSQTLDIKGSLLYETGKSQQALEIWREGAKNHPTVQGKKLNQMNQAQAMQSLGLYPRACQTLLETLELDSSECHISASQIESVKTRLLANPDDSYQNKALRNLGHVLRVIGDIQDSQQVLQTSLEIAQQSDSSADLSKTLLSLADTEKAIASRAREIGDFAQLELAQQKAINYYQKAIDLSPSTITKTQAQLKQIELLIDQENWQQAQQLLPSITESIDNLPLNRDKIYAQINYSKNLLCIQQQEVNCLSPQKLNLDQVDEQSVNQSINLLTKANQSAQSLQDQHTQSYIAGTIARIYESRQNWQQAQQYTQQALYASWQAQAGELTYQWQWQEGRLLKAQGQDEQARQKYAEAVNTLKSLRSDLVAINPEIQFTFREGVEPVYRQYVSLLLEPNNDQSLENLELARETIDSLQLSELENFFRLVCLDATPVILDEITDQSDPNSAVIYPILLDDRFEIILKLPGQNLRHYTTAITDKQEVDLALTRLPLSLTQANSSETLPLAQQVYDWLLRPAEQDLAQSGVTNLVFVLDSALRNIPMSVLNDGEQYLIEKYSVALIPSLQLLEPESFQQKKADTLVAGLSKARDKFAPLTYVPEEIQQVRSQVPQSEELFNETFTNQKFQTTVNSAPFSVVHLATHGQFSSILENTFILTWDDRLNVNQLNRLIKAKDSEAIELLVLSACETLKGDDRASLGLAGVAIRAGARSTLATLWQVNDQTTSELMSQFYTNLNQPNITKAEALRQAQLALLNSSDANSNRPYFWGAYVLVGNWL